MDVPLLEGRYERLVPLSTKHTNVLFKFARDTRLFRYLPLRISDVAEMRSFVTQALTECDAGRAIPFVIQLLDGTIVGTTRFAAIERKHSRGEIGWTWLSGTVRRTPVNTECKRLLLNHGFETLRFNRVEFKTDLRNTASQVAIARLGAKQEGVSRHRMVMPDGYIRDTIGFSILREEWPAIRQRLDGFLARPYSFSFVTV